MGAKYGGQKLLLVALVLISLLAASGCKPNTKAVTRIALLAPFEGRYRELGYNAYYAARLAMQSFADNSIELIPMDDGGTVATAVDRAEALLRDPLVQVMVVLGQTATDAKVQKAFGNLPLILVGNWGNAPDESHVYALTNPTIEQTTTDITEAAKASSPITGGDVLGLAQFPMLRADSADVTVVSSGSLPDTAFRERYLGSAQFVPEPGLLASLTYDAFGMAIQAAQSSNPNDSLMQMDYAGLNGSIRFEHGYWADAPLHQYCYKPDSAQHSGWELKTC